MTLSKRENKIGVSRTSYVLGGSRTRLVLGGSVLGGDGLDIGVDELPAVTMMATSILGGDDLDSSADELPVATSISLSLSLSTFSICKMLFEGKTTMKMVLQVRGGILRSKCKTFSV